MNNVEQLEKSIKILEKLANGINPIDDSILSADSPINNVEITRALFCILSQLNTKLNTKPKSRGKKKQFFVDENKLATFEFKPDGAYLSQIVNNLNTLIDENEVKSLSRKRVVSWLIDIGFLETVILDDGKTKRHLPTAQGLKMGLELVELTDKYGTPFQAVKYPLSMQQFIIDNIDSLYSWLNKQRTR